MGYICTHYKEVIVSTPLSHSKFPVSFPNFHLSKCPVAKYTWKPLSKESRYRNINVTDKIPPFVLTFSCSEYRKSTVRLKCAEGNSDQTSFQITDEDNWVSEEKIG